MKVIDRPTCDQFSYYPWTNESLQYPRHLKPPDKSLVNRVLGYNAYFVSFQPCPEPVDFREHQCAAYNDVPYHDQYLKWSAHYDTNDPCALTCRGRPDNELDDGSDDEALIVVVLAPKVQDGTRCRHGSLDMCINGKCQVNHLFILKERLLNVSAGPENRVSKIFLSRLFFFFF